MSTFSDVNAKAWNELSATYNTKPWQKEMSSQITAALRAQKDSMGVPWTQPTDGPIRRDVRLLDYACGTGLITQALGPYVTTIRGIDVSEGMVAKYNEAAESSGMSQEQAHAVVGDLFAQTVAPELCTSEWYNFDVAVIGLGFHHFEHPDLAIKRLAERLKPETGVLVIVDFLPFEASGHHHHHGHGHGHQHDKPAEEGPSSSSSTNEDSQSAHKNAQHTIKTNGFSPAEMRDFYTNAGFVPESFQITALKEPFNFTPEADKPSLRKIFICYATKSPTTWQKLVNWVGGGQDAVAQQLRTDRVDAQMWRPGFETGPERENAWGVGKTKEEGWGGFGQNAEKKSWNGF